MSQPDSKANAPRGGVFVTKPKSNVYTVMLALSLLAIIVGCLFLYLEIQSYEGEISPPTSMLTPAAVQPLYGMSQAAPVSIFMS